MFRKIAVALIATSMFVAPALAAETAKTAPAPAAPTATVKSEAAKPAVKTIKAVKSVKVVKTHRHVRHVVRHRGHVKHVIAKAKAKPGHRMVRTKKVIIKKNTSAFAPLFAPMTRAN
jgi:hypothetical protein